MTTTIGSAAGTYESGKGLVSPSEFDIAKLGREVALLVYLGYTESASIIEQLLRAGFQRMTWSDPSSLVIPQSE